MALAVSEVNHDGYPGVLHRLADLFWPFSSSLASFSGDASIPIVDSTILENHARQCLKPVELTESTETPA